METISGPTALAPRQACNPHIKQVLKTFQLSAVRSLHGPSTVLSATSSPTTTEDTDASVATASTSASSPPAPVPSAPPGDQILDAFLQPPPFPIQSLPILTAPDQGGAERTLTSLEGVQIACFVVGGEKRLCLPQVLNSVLRDFTLAQINAVCDDLHIYCSRCNPEQLEVLQASGTLPATVSSCGLITQTDAERLCAALLPRGHQLPTPKTQCVSGGPNFQVYHECFGKCRGVCRPDEGLARSIECMECRLLFDPQQFVSHAHRPAETSTVHWGFDSTNWRAYLLLVPDQPGAEALHKQLERFKNRAAAKLKRRQESPEICKSDKERELQLSQHAAEAQEAHLQYLKKARMEEAAAAGVPASFLSYPDPYYYWYDSWACVSAFRPWPPLITKDGKPAPLPFLRDSLPGVPGIPSVPPYLSQGPPVLLHPERVVPMSEYQRFERTFQPNVALAPLGPTTLQDREEAPPEKRPRTRSPSPAASPRPSAVSPCPSPASAAPQPSPRPRPRPRSPTPTPSSTTPTISKAPPAPTTPEPQIVPGSVRNADIELSTDEDSASESAADSGVDTSVAAVLESLSSDEKDAKMAGVLRSLATRLGAVEAERGRLGAENEALRRRTRQLDAIIQQKQRVIERLQDERDRLSIKQHDPEAFLDKMMAMDRELRTLRGEVNGNLLPNSTRPEEDRTDERSEQRAPSAISVIHKTESVVGSD